MKGIQQCIVHHSETLSTRAVNFHKCQQRSSKLKVSRFQSSWWNTDVRVRLYHMTFMTFKFRHYLRTNSSCPNRLVTCVADKPHACPYLAILLRAVPLDSSFSRGHISYSASYISTLQLLSVGSWSMTSAVTEDSIAMVYIWWGNLKNLREMKLRWHIHRIIIDGDKRQLPESVHLTITSASHNQNTKI